MRDFRRIIDLGCAAATLATSVATAQTPAPTTASASTSAGPAPRALPAPTITSPRFAGSAFQVVALPNGTLLVNDLRNRRVMLSDSTLRVTTVVIDSAEYGAGQASLLRYPGDSVALVEARTPSVTLIDPTGKVVRKMAVANPRDAAWLLPSPSNMAGIDSRGRFVHRGLAPRVEQARIKPNEQRTRAYPDSNPIIRDNPVTHAGDTVAWHKSIALTGVEVARADGRSMFYARPAPVKILDEWVVLSTGSIAVLRGRDYHIDLIDENGKMTALPRIPYPWERLSDEAKVALVDSLAKDLEESMKSPPIVMGGGGAAASGGAGGGMAGGAAASLSDFPPPPPGSMTIKPEEVPDYRAPFLIGALRADVDGNAWIRTEQRVGDTTKVVYDVVTSAGKLLDRVLVPKDRSIVGFDRRGNMFLVGRAEGGVQWIERVRWRD